MALARRTVLFLFQGTLGLGRLYPQTDLFSFRLQSPCIPAHQVLGALKRMHILSSTTNEDVVRTHICLVLTFADAQTAKMQREPVDDSSITGSSAMLSNLFDYPLVKYWERKVRKSVTGTRKDTSELQTKTGSCGGTRSSKGENIMMLYIKDSNIAGGMRELARSIWRSFYERATMEVREEYCQEMESKYLVLRLCNNGRQVQLPPVIYSQWHRTYNKKMKPLLDSDNSSKNDSSDGSVSNDDTGNGSSGPPRKKARTTTIVNDNSHFTLPESETHIDSEDMSIDAIPTVTNNSTESSQPHSDVLCVEDSRSLSCHGTALKDPLSNIFVQPTSQFQILKSVPNIIQQVGSSTEEHDTIHTASVVAIENADQAMDAPNVDLIAQAPEVLNINSLHLSTSTNFCAAEWCSSNPEGTVGAFNQHWDEVQKDKEKMVEYKRKEKEGHAALPHPNDTNTHPDKNLLA
ncbi:hypothetical protein V8E52_007652 [Russula decolorans]